MSYIKMLYIVLLLFSRKLEIVYMFMIVYVSVFYFYFIVKNVKNKK